MYINAVIEFNIDGDVHMNLYVWFVFNNWFNINDGIIISMTCIHNNINIHFNIIQLNNDDDWYRIFVNLVCT